MGIIQRLKSVYHSFESQRMIKAAVQALPPEKLQIFLPALSVGNYDRGRVFLSGAFLKANQSSGSKNHDLWEIESTHQPLLHSLHAFDWIEDLAAVNTIEAVRAIRRHSGEWITKYARTDGPHWSPDLNGWRVIRMLTHAEAILDDANVVERDRFYKFLATSNHILNKTLDNAPIGLPRFVALTASIALSLTLESENDSLRRKLHLLNDEAEALIGNDQIDLPSRDIEELCLIFYLLVLIDVIGADLEIGEYHDLAIEKLGRTLRAFRQANGEIFNPFGGDKRLGEIADRALVESLASGVSAAQPLLGFAHVSVSGLRVFIDFDAPPQDTINAHASTLGLWVSDRRQSIIGSTPVSNHDVLNKRIAAQETASHSTMVVNGTSSSELELAPAQPLERQIGAHINQRIEVFGFDYEMQDLSILVEGSHNGYVAPYGLTHQRKFSIDRDGKFFAGVDMLYAATTKDEEKISAHIKKSRSSGLHIAAIFQLGAGITPELSANKKGASFNTEAGINWVMRQQGGTIEIAQNYAEDEFGEQTPTNYKIIIHSRLTSPSGYISWAFQAQNS